MIALHQFCQQWLDQIETNFFGQRSVCEAVLITMLLEESSLLRGPAGTGKSQAVSNAADLLGRTFCKLSLTAGDSPELLHAKCEDLCRNCPDCPVFLLEDIHLADARTLVWLLESIRERQFLPADLAANSAFPCVFATFQPNEDGAERGELPASQQDRFLFQVDVGYPDRESEMRLSSLSARVDLDVIGTLGPELREQIRDVEFADGTVAYATDIVRNSRFEGETPDFVYEWVGQGVSPQGLHHLLRAAQAMAAVQGAKEVQKTHVRAVVYPCLRHRITLTPTAVGNGITTDLVIDRLLEHVAHLGGESSDLKRLLGN